MSFLINPYAFLAAGGDFESIATVTVGSGGASSIEFTSIPGTYQHLQIRWTARATRSATSDSLRLRFNDASTNHWFYHDLYGEGASAVADNSPGAGGYCYIGNATGATALADTFAAGATDIVDYSSTSKNKTVRYFQGFDRNGAGTVSIGSAAWFNTSAITKMVISATTNNIAQHSTFALYGIKAP